MTQHAVTIRLPWPPSVNRYWRRHLGRVLISRDGRRYRKDVEALVAVIIALLTVRLVAGWVAEIVTLFSHPLLRSYG